MTTKVIVTGGTNSSSPESFTVASSNASVFGASSGYQKVIINSGVTGVTLDANIEEIQLSGALSAYTFKATSGTGLEIKSGNDVVATLGSINQTVQIKFSDLSATLRQTGSSTFTLEGNAIGTTGFASVSMNTTVSLTYEQASAAISSGARYLPTQDITITGTGAQLGTLAPTANALGGKSITLDASDNTVSLTLSQASDTIAFGGVKFAASDTVTVGTATNNGDVPISLAAALVDLGKTGTHITLDQDVVMTDSAQTSADGVNSSNKWHFDTSLHNLTYYSSGVKHIILTGVSTVTVSGGDMTMTLA